MPNLLDKLNTLVKASLNNFVDETTGKLSASGRGPRLGKDIDSEIVALRKRIEQAISDEDAMQQRITDMDQQVALYDQQIDEALQRGDDANARLLSQQMQTKQRQSSILQADLEEHRRSTSDLIQHVNTLEAMVADARREQESKGVAQTSPDQAAEASQSGSSLSSLLRDARERVETMLPGAPQEAVHIPIHIDTDSAASDEAATNADDSQIDTDLAKRRSRLSKPEQPQQNDKPD
jgi:phage shock protein A